MAKKILIVEDEQETSAFLKNKLNQLNFHTETSGDGGDAINKMKTFMPDLVLLDIMLPVIDGIEVLKWIKTNQPQVLVIMTTAKKEVSDLKTGYSLEADYYITKPYTFEEIIKGINVLMSLKGDEVN
ncbi:MAG: response regulator [Candidatus Omnitrophota bacterium]